MKKFKSVLVALLTGVMLVVGQHGASAAPLPPGHEGDYYKFTIDDHQTIGAGVLSAANGGKIEVSYLAHFRKWTADGFIQPWSIKFYQHHHPIVKGGGWPYDIQWVKYHVTFTSDKVLEGKQEPRHATLKMYPEYYDQKFDLTSLIKGYYAHNNPRMCITVQFDIAFSPDVHESMGCHRLTNWD